MNEIGKRFLRGACKDGRRWAMKYKTLGAAWEASTWLESEWLLWALNKSFPAGPLRRRIQLGFGLWCATKTPLHDGRVVSDLLEDPRSRVALDLAEEVFNGTEYSNAFLAGAADAAWEAAQFSRVLAIAAAAAAAASTVETARSADTFEQAQEIDCAFKICRDAAEQAAVSLLWGGAQDKALAEIWGLRSTWPEVVQATTADARAKLWEQFNGMAIKLARTKIDELLINIMNAQVVALKDLTGNPFRRGGAGLCAGEGFFLQPPIKKVRPHGKHKRQSKEVSH